MYMLVALIGASLGVGFSIILRLEIALPGLILSSSLQYNTSISFHGILMIFFMIMPLLIGGFGNLLVPLMLCSCDMIFPRVNALSL
jgi:heme/copper-type cytochrome/quinol oxidase subunit 1